MQPDRVVRKEEPVPDNENLASSRHDKKCDKTKYFQALTRVSNYHKNTVYKQILVSYFVIVLVCLVFSIRDLINILDQDIGVMHDYDPQPMLHLAYHVFRVRSKIIGNVHAVQSNHHYHQYHQHIQ